MSIIKKLNPKSIKKILIIQLGPFGDVFLTTSYFEELKKKFIHAEIHYLTKKKYSAILKNHPFIDKIITTGDKHDKYYVWNRIKKILEIRQNKYDIVIDQQNKPSSQQFTWLSGARFRVGYANGRLNMAYNLKASRGPIRYSASRKFDILQPLGIEFVPYKLYCNVTKESEKYIDNWLEKENLSNKKLVIFSPGSPLKWKIWNPDYYSQLADKLAKDGFSIIWLWGPSELDLVKSIKNKMNEESIIALPTTFNQALALLKKSELLVCNDGGMNHLSTTANIKTLAMFGSTDTVTWSPASVFKTHHHLCNKENDSFHDNTFGITPEAAYQKIREIMNEK